MKTSVLLVFALLVATENILDVDATPTAEQHGEETQDARARRPCPPHTIIAGVCVTRDEIYRCLRIGNTCVRQACCKVLHSSIVL